ncbi:amino acid transporter protein [Klebsormidium nitens]|uniref:Amino acid transporter protein n=1 Tax=Klebsormidium nitens TaxID=105231 RepID=A0A0U9HJM6_KLENI|nr:amino acid transporter protein [Klebsormidium nitens]|eukprot:GAQ82658.1 amino acid transporter protein [Klebsormidium nitens]
MADGTAEANTTGEGPIKDSGQARLEQLGYKQELSRTLSLLVNVALGYGTMSILMSNTGLYGLGFTYGGPVTIIWGWLVVSFFVLCIAVSMGMLCSSFPTAGGLYFWSYSLAGPKYGPLCAWFTVWFNYLGDVLGMAVVNYVGATILATMVVIASGEGGGVEGGAYVATKGVMVAFAGGLYILQVAVNVFDVRVLAFFGKAGLVLEIVGLAVVIIALLAVSERKQSADFVFTHWEPATGLGIHSTFYIFLLGLLPACFTINGFDAPAHMSEETERSDRTAPLSIVVSVAVAVFTGFAFLLTLTFCIQDPATLFDPGNATAGLSAGGQIFFDAFASRGYTHNASVALLSLPLVSSFLGGMALLAAMSRIMFAVSRDGALPFSAVLRLTSRTSHVPVVAVCVSAALSFSFVLFSLKSYVAFNAVTSAAQISAYLAYGTPILLRMLNPGAFVPGPFDMGKWSYVFGTISIAYISFMCGVFCLPTVYPITSDTLNWAPVILASVIILASVVWVTYSRDRYLSNRKGLVTPGNVGKAGLIDHKL